jgi:hypothetical protein
MDVNEEIIAQYLQTIKKWFYMSDIAFKVPHNYSNIDLLAYSPEEDKYYDIEVKFRSAYTISQKNLENDTDFNKYVEQLIKPERQDAIKSIIGNRPITKIFVTTHSLFGKSIVKRKQIEKEMKDRLQKFGFESEIWYFDEIIPHIYEKIEKSGRYNTELMQTIRLIKTYTDDKKIERY